MQGAVGACFAMQSGCCCVVWVLVRVLFGQGAGSFWRCLFGEGAVVVGVLFGGFVRGGCCWRCLAVGASVSAGQDSCLGMQCGVLVTVLSGVLKVQWQLLAVFVWRLSQGAAAGSRLSAAAGAGQGVGEVAGQGAEFVVGLVLAWRRGQGDVQGAMAGIGDAWGLLVTVLFVLCRCLVVWGAVKVQAGYWSK